MRITDLSKALVSISPLALTGILHFSSLHTTPALLDHRRRDALHPLGDSRALNRRGKCSQEADNSYDENAKDLLGKNVAAKPRKREVRPVRGWRFRQGRNEPKPV